MPARDLARAVWRKSSLSGGSGGDCVEVAVLDGRDLPTSHKSSDKLVAVRDSRDPAGPVLAFTPREWDAFLGGVRAGEFDLG
jgi:hypothetical protein